MSQQNAMLATMGVAAQEGLDAAPPWNTSDRGRVEARPVAPTPVMRVPRGTVSCYLA
ncbi:hypothetical protein AB0H88_37355 [Nonomuraea sp. NPDC050680]|uniref:hypothetical protein n=1 Tax=Nonomuraea sp. NPDC050680 TaxID=3154630 RepID=UPI0033F607D6